MNFILRIVFITLLSPIIFLSNLYSAEIYLKNGDKISGEIIAEDDKSISIQTEAIGIVSINKEFLDHIEGDKVVLKEAEKEKLWEGKVSAGYNKASGNTENDQAVITIYANRKTINNEFTIKGDGYYSTSNKISDGQRLYGMARYAYSFWKRKWYNFYKLEGEHDRFADISYRIIPSTGLGYWFSDTEKWKVMAECGIGYEYTKFRSNIDGKKEVVLIPRMFLEKKLFSGMIISEELSFYNSIEDIGEYRLHSETVLTYPINQKLSLRFSLVDDYNKTPAEGVKKNDLRFISSIEYYF